MFAWLLFDIVFIAIFNKPPPHSERVPRHYTDASFASFYSEMVECPDLSRAGQVLRIERVRKFLTAHRVSWRALELV